MHPYSAQLIENGESYAERRERLILEQLPQVNLIARRFHERLPQCVNLDDLVSIGTLGLISAIDNFVPSQGVKLNTYAEYKIRGAILDSLRSMDWASRYRRKKAKDIEAAINAVEQRLSRPATGEEVAAEMGITIEEYQERLSNVQGLNLESLEKRIGPDGSQTLLSIVPDTDGPSPFEVLERGELERLLATLIERMPSTERMILSMYYKDELTLREIAGILKMQISRVSELKAHSILRLRAALRRQWPTTRGL
jgi:RNA polymerase sigma factor for flagellar operon FliA